MLRWQSLDNVLEPAMCSLTPNRDHMCRFWSYGFRLDNPSLSHPLYDLFRCAINSQRSQRFCQFRPSVVIVRCLNNPSVFPYRWIIFSDRGKRIDDISYCLVIS